MADWLTSANQWNRIFKAAMALEGCPEGPFHELGRALHSYHVTGERGALADALEEIARQLRE